MRAARDECGSVAAVNAGEESLPFPPAVQRRGRGPRLHAALLQYRTRAQAAESRPSTSLRGRAAEVRPSSSRRCLALVASSGGGAASAGERAANGGVASVGEQVAPGSTAWVGRERSSAGTQSHHSRLCDEAARGAERASGFHAGGEEGEHRRVQMAEAKA
ncbi:unnamed protein product [Miscanthus lutarioriparius]|uniref:Uncharacterized protein n=1 Tax=Miscanthus lutarioriparius TaxID=422564 RepID=A0A811PZ08_9POAL|nr:unnamed protein product [Miscanthus lutarioriparius]